MVNGDRLASGTSARQLRQTELSVLDPPFYTKYEVDERSAYKLLHAGVSQPNYFAPSLRSPSQPSKIRVHTFNSFLWWFVYFLVVFFAWPQLRNARRGACSHLGSMLHSTFHTLHEQHMTDSCYILLWWTSIEASHDRDLHAYPCISVYIRLIYRNFFCHRHKSKMYERFMYLFCFYFNI